MNRSPIRATRVLTDPVHLLAFGFGTGLSGIAPGTIGTLVGVPLALALALVPLWGRIIAISFLLLVGIWLCGNSARRLGVHDHPGIVFDEIVGYQVAVIVAPDNVLTLVVGFILFRFFDILKPWPIGWLDRRIGGGTGIMLDDIAAGVYAGALWFGISSWIALIQ